MHNGNHSLLFTGLVSRTYRDLSIINSKWFQLDIIGMKYAQNETTKQFMSVVTSLLLWKINKSPTLLFWLKESMFNTKVNASYFVKCKFFEIKRYLSCFSFVSVNKRSWYCLPSVSYMAANIDLNRKQSLNTWKWTLIANKCHPANIILSCPFK